MSTAHALRTTAYIVATLVVAVPTSISPPAQTQPAVALTRSSIHTWAAGNPSVVRMGLQVKPFNAPISWNEDHYVYLRPNGTYYW